MCFCNLTFHLSVCCHALSSSFPFAHFYPSFLVCLLSFTLLFLPYILASFLSLLLLHISLLIPLPLYLFVTLIPSSPHPQFHFPQSLFSLLCTTFSSLLLTPSIPIFLCLSFTLTHTVSHFQQGMFLSNTFLSQWRS